MSIKELKVEGFRSLRGVTWEPGRLNVVIGPNGAGKSNLMRALWLLQKAADGDVLKEIVRMGGISPLLWDGQADEIRWSLRPDASAFVPPTTLSYQLTVERLGFAGACFINHERLEKLQEPGALGWAALFERGPTYATAWTLPSLNELNLQGKVSDGTSMLGLLGGPLGDPVVSRLRTMILGWSMYHDLRVDPGAELRRAAVARVERRLDWSGQNLIPVLHTLYTGDRGFKQIVDDAMRVAFSGDYDEIVFPPAADQRVQLRVRWRSLRTEQSAADLSDGTLRFLSLLAILGNPDPGTLVWIDEPETGLHPSMLPVVAELAVEASRRTQVILATHSTQLLDAFSETQPTTTVVQWQDGETRLAVVDGEELARWLQTYSLGALFRSGELEGMV